MVDEPKDPFVERLLQRRGELFSAVTCLTVKKRRHGLWTL